MSWRADITDWWQDRHARKAARLLQQRRFKRERRDVRAKARELCIEAGKPIPRALRAI